LNAGRRNPLQQENAMTCATQALTGHASLSARQRAAHFLRQEWEAFWTRKSQHATVRVLRGLDDATLRDIGLSRSEIESVVYGTPGDRRVHYGAR
jgi:uncharacterized protein YjiS (DUF1127 family)